MRQIQMKSIMAAGLISLTLVACSGSKTSTEAHLLPPPRPRRNPDRQ